MSRENIKLGACDVTFKSVALGLTKGGVEVSVETSTYPITVDQHGETAVDEFITKRQFKVTVPLAETKLDLLGLALPGSTVENGQLIVKDGIGLSLIDSAGALQLIPTTGGSAEEPITFLKANTAGNFSFAYRHNEERVYNVEFTVYPDELGVLGTFGSPAPTPTPTPDPDPVTTP
ncbi:hypothetical protein [Vreelandella sulfidaeris]|uniref:Uncharacterized protein n=1 Tax=Vreelandella sulfidaeris TaxID=115553 RepID=A0A455U8W4_9GAMM|nr:hypothetical protein HSBAA_29790 [Halomonas sulfidaeris]